MWGYVSAQLVPWPTGGEDWGLRIPDAYLLVGGLGANRAVCGTPDVLGPGSACCWVEPRPGDPELVLACWCAGLRVRASCG